MEKRYRPVKAEISRQQAAEKLRAALNQTQGRYPVRRIHLHPSIYNYLRLGGELGREQSSLWGIPVFADRSLPPFGFAFLEQERVNTVEKEFWAKT